LKYLRLFESPDGLHYNNQTLEWGDVGTYAFGYYDFDMMVSSETDNHPSMNYKYNKNNIDRTRLTYPGRIWTKEKVITFWKYPPPNKLRQLFNDLEKEFEKDNVDIDYDFWNNYKIQVDKGVLQFYGNDQELNRFDEYVSPKEYVGSHDVPEEEFNKEHELSPLKKNKKIKPYSKNRPLKFKQYLLRSESIT
jgi:hypothetical protein